MTKRKELSISYKNRTEDIASSQKYFSQDEILAILSVLHEEENRLLFLLGLDLGARVSEMCSLSWSNVNWKNKFITIWDEKKDKWRTCTVSEQTWELLKEYSKSVDKRKEERVFPISYKTVNRRIKDWAMKAGIERPVRWHFVRHTLVVQSRRAGRDWDWISQQTGDRASTLIQEYSRLSMEDRQKITDEKPLIQEVEKE